MQLKKILVLIIILLFASVIVQGIDYDQNPYKTRYNPFGRHLQLISGIFGLTNKSVILNTDYNITQRYLNFSTSNLSIDWLFANGMNISTADFENISVSNDAKLNNLKAYSGNAINLETNLDGTGYDVVAQNLNASNDVTVGKDVDAGGNFTLGEKITFALGEIIDNIVNGWIRITGGLNVTESAEIQQNLTVIDTTTSTRITDGTILITNGDLSGAINVNATYVNANNVTVSEYFIGQPLDGGLDSGVIYASDIDNNGDVNLTHIAGTRDITYPNMIVRIVDSPKTVKYCNITSDGVNVTDNQHSVYYTDNTCAVQSDTFANFIAFAISPNSKTELFNAMAHNGEAEVHKGVAVSNKIESNLREAHYYTEHLNIVRGMAVTTDTFPEYLQASGKYMYLRTPVDSTTQNTTLDGIEIVSHNDTTSTWGYWDQNGINLTHCDNGSDYVDCSNNLFRRYVLFTVGFSNGDDETELHMLAPLDSETYASVGLCLNTVSTPVSYTLPALYDNTAVPGYVYCGRRDDAAWSTNFIDLREGTQGFGASPDLSIFLTKDGTRPLTGDWDVGGYDIAGVKNSNASTVYTENLSVSVNVISNLNASGHNITADFFIGSVLIVNGSTFENITVTNDASILNLLGLGGADLNLEANCDGSGFNITADNFSCVDCLGTNQIQNIFLLLTGGSLTGDVAMGTNDITGIKDLNSTNIDTTNLRATNLEKDLDGTGVNVTLNNLLAVNLFGIAGADLNLETNLDGTGFNMTAANFSCTDCLGLQQIQNIYLLLTGGSLTGDLALGNNDITGVKDMNSTDVGATNMYITNMEQNLDGTGFNVTVDCIIFDSGGKICANP